MDTVRSDKHILLLNNYAKEGRSPVEDFRPFFRYPFTEIIAREGKIPTDATDFSHIILSGSSADLHGDWQSLEASLIKSALDKNVPLLGVCFGHQLIVHTLFGRELVAPMDKENHGWHELEIVEDDPLLGLKGEKCFVYSHHSWEVKSIPPEFTTITARSGRCPISGFRINGKKMWGLQPHFEISMGIGIEKMKNSKTEEELWVYLDNNPPKDSGLIFRIMKSFQNQ